MAKLCFAFSLCDMFKFCASKHLKPGLLFPTRWNYIPVISFLHCDFSIHIFWQVNWNHSGCTSKRRWRLLRRTPWNGYSLSYMNFLLFLSKNRIHILLVRFEWAPLVATRSRRQCQKLRIFCGKMFRSATVFFRSIYTSKYPGSSLLASPDFDNVY